MTFLLEGLLAKLERLEVRDAKVSGDTATATLVASHNGREEPAKIELVRAGAGWAIDAIVY